jgi:trk system potassium uptake protein TrkA
MVFGKRKKNRQFLVVGLGRFGRALATQLEGMDAEVLGLDCREDRIREVSPILTHTLIGDATEEKVIASLGVDQFDAAICGIGHNLEASVMACMLLKEYHVPHLVAKATSEIHGKCLHKIGADRVVFPERDVAERLARDFLVDRSLVEILPLSVQHSMFELKAPKEFAGFTLAQLDVRAKLAITIVAIRRGDETVVSPMADEVIRRHDVLVAVGDRQEAEAKLKTLVKK